MNKENEPKKCILVEFSRDARALEDYCRKYEFDLSEFLIIALQPEVKTYCREKQLKHTDTLPFFDNDSHRRASIKSHRLTTLIREELRLDIITRIAKLKSPPEDVNLNIAMKLEAKAKPAMVKDDPEETLSRLKTVADVLNRVDKEMEHQVLGKISETDADMAEEIRELMFTFEDLLLVDKRAMQKILSGINVQVLAMALKGATKNVEDYIMGNVSIRVRKLIEDEKELMGPQPMEEVVTGQKEIVATVRALIESGEISINRSTEEELIA